MVEQTQSDANPTLAAAKDQFVDSRRKGTGGRYATELDRVLSSWLEWCAKRGATDTSDVSDRLLANYARHLGQRVRARVSDPDDDSGVSGRTAHQYWGYIRSFLSYCVEWGYIPQNPAKQGHVVDELPEESLGTDDSDEQTWSPDERRALLDYVDERAREAIDADGLDADGPVRDRAIVYVLAYTGARGAELFRDPDDDRRDGLQWSDIDFEATRISALGKSQDYEAVQFPEAAHSALRQHKRVQDPPADDWPVFPTRHRPTLAQLEADADGDRDDEQSLAEYLHEHDLEPPSITTTGVRSVLQRLCEADAVTVEGDHEYLKPHGARRGIGKALYKNHSHEAAQKALRHQDPATTSEMYADIEAGEVAAIADDVLENE